MLVRDGTHDAPDGQTVEIIVDENQHTKRNGRKLCADPRLDMRRCPTSERRRPTCPIHQADHCAQNDKEYQNSNVVAVGQHRRDPVAKHMNDRPFKIKVGIQQSAEHDADQQ